MAGSVWANSKLIAIGCAALAAALATSFWASIPRMRRPRKSKIDRDDLPVEVWAKILGKMTPREMIASRGISKLWRVAVDQELSTRLWIVEESDGRVRDSRGPAFDCVIASMRSLLPSWATTQNLGRYLFSGVPGSWNSSSRGLVVGSCEDEAGSYILFVGNPLLRLWDKLPDPDLGNISGLYVSIEHKSDSSGSYSVHVADPGHQRAKKLDSHEGFFWKEEADWAKACSFHQELRQPPRNVPPFPAAATRARVDPNAATSVRFGSVRGRSLALARKSRGNDFELWELVGGAWSRLGAGSYELDFLLSGLCDDDSDWKAFFGDKLVVLKWLQFVATFDLGDDADGRWHDLEKACFVWQPGFARP